jgi:AbrB family looped-hinge helix DNA binding protein
MESMVVKITKKGQATIPKDFRMKFWFEDRAIVIETKEGILLKPIPETSEEKGSLRGIFKDKMAEEILREARKEDMEKERVLGLR